ncbi:hypothetical protein Celaphus_00018836, partial [Cervus elaphus hippelaphus]
MEGVYKMYAEHLKRMNPNSLSITYDINQLFDFIIYQPCDKDWIKEKIYVLFRQQAQQAGRFGSIKGTEMNLE